MSDQFGFFATLEDDWMLIEDVLSPGDLRVFHDSGSFPTTNVRYFASLTGELKDLLRPECKESLFVAGSFTRFPPEFHIVETGPQAGQYWIDIDHGGPLIGLRLGVLRHLIDDPNPQPQLLSGEVWYQPDYKNPITGLYEPASAEVKAAYKSIVKRMKRHLKRYQQDGTNWFGPEAFALFKAGKAFIPSPAVPVPRGGDPDTAPAK